MFIFIGHTMLCPIILIVITTTTTITPHSVLRQVHSLFQSEFTTHCDLVLPLSISSTYNFLKVIQ